MPTPKDMPGAVAVAPPSEESPAVPEAPAVEQETEDDPYQLDSEVTDAAAEVQRLRNLLRRTRKFEDKAKQNAAKAQLWDQNADKVKNWEEHEKATLTETQRLAAERDQARQELEAERQAKLRIKIASETKVPERFVTGTTETEMREAAEEYNEAREREVEARLKALNINPAAPASAVTSDGKPNQVKQLTRADLSTMSPQEILAADKNGQLDELKGRTT